MHQVVDRQGASSTDPSHRPASNQSDATTSARCNWDQARAELTGLPDGGLNVAFEALDRHLLDGLADQTALRWIGPDGDRRDFSYRDLAQATSRFAHLLRQLGVQPGERVSSLLGRVPELYVTALGTLKAGCVFLPLFSVFGPEPAQAPCWNNRPSLMPSPSAWRTRPWASWSKDWSR